MPIFGYILVDSRIFRILAQLDIFMYIKAYSEPMAYSALIRIADVQGGPQKCPYFSLAITKETFKIFSPQILEVCRILLVQTTLESPMFYYTFSVINDRFDPGTALLYVSSNSNIKIAHNCIEHFLWNLSGFSSDVVFENLCCLWIVFINSVFQVSP